MTAEPPPHGGNGIRPLAPDDGFPPFRSRPRIGPLLAVAAAIALLVLVGIVGIGTPPLSDPDPEEPGGGGLASGDPEITTTTTTTTTTTRAPTLADFAPLDSPLVVIPDERDTLLYLWHPSAEEAQWIALASIPQHASFDATGRWLAYLPDEGGELWTGLATGAQWAQWSGVTAAAWHPEFEGNLAWSGTGAGGDETYGIRIGGVERRTGRLIETVLAVTLEPGLCLDSWGDWGFAVVPCESGTGLWIYSPDGGLIASGDQRLVSASASGRFLVANEFDDFAVVDTRLEPVDTFTLDGSADLALTDDGTEVLEVVPTGTRTRVRSYSVGRPEGRSTSVTEAGTLVGLSGDQQFAVLHMPGTGELVLVNWRTGVTFRIPGDWPRVAAVWVP